jgi:hypothetical protein
MSNAMTSVAIPKKEVREDECRLEVLIPSIFPLLQQPSIVDLILFKAAVL